MSRRVHTTVDRLLDGPLRIDHQSVGGHLVAYLGLYGPGVFTLNQYLANGTPRCDRLEVPVRV